jgi:hypothetical protein
MTSYPNPGALLVAYTQLGPNAQRVLLMIADRLVKGAKQYGDFDADRDWVHEAFEEACDQTVYLAIRALLAKEK